MNLKNYTFRVSTGLCWLGLTSAADVYEQSNEDFGVVRRGQFLD